MNLSDCLPEKISKLFIGVLFILFGVAALVAGFTILPIFGLVVAIVMFFIGGYFIRVHLNQACEISGSEASE